jgi:hypothetical protein
LNKVRQKADDRREKRWEEERVQAPKVIVFYQEGLEGKVIREEQVDGKLVKREEVLLE